MTYKQKTSLIAKISTIAGKAYHTVQGVELSNSKEISEEQDNRLNEQLDNLLTDFDKLIINLLKLEDQ